MLRRVPILTVARYRLTTAQIFYHLPDHPHILQEFIWQDMDVAPEWPKLHQFLEFWRRNIEGPLHSVRVANTELIKPGSYRNAAAELTLH